MNKRLVKLVALGMTAGMLAGCAGKPVTVENVNFTEKAEKEDVVVMDGQAVKTGLSIISTLTAESAGEKDGTASTDISLVAVTVDDEGVITDCVIDAIQGKVSFGAEGQLTSEAGAVLSKNELGEQYGMKQVSSIGKEWNEQAAAIADYAVGKTVEELKTGAADDADLASSATIYLGGFISAIEDAVNKAEHMGAVQGDKLVLTSINTTASSSEATAEAAGNAQFDANVAVLTMNGDVITSCLIDAVQSKVAFDANGAVAGEVPGNILSKNELGEQYGLKKFSPIGKEWNEQTAAFCAYVTGKTVEEAAGIAVDEGTVPTEADLVSSVTIRIGDFMALIEKAAAEEEAVKTGLSIISTLTAESAGEKDGTASTDISLVAVTVDDEGVITDCVIDAIQGKVSFGAEGQLTSESGAVLSKNELGKQYGMKQASSIGKEWNEQAAAIADYAVGKTVEELKAGAVDETGAVKDADLASSATIYLGGFISAIEDAVNKAEHMGAVQGDELVLTSINTTGSSSEAIAEEAGNAQFDANVAVLTMNGDVITSCLIDAVQSKVAFDTNGAVAGEVPGNVLSKNELGEQYGLKQFSPIGKEWNEQTEAFCKYVTGKTAEEAAGIAVDETTVPTEADLVSSVTIRVGDFMALIEKAAKQVR